MTTPEQKIFKTPPTPAEREAERKRIKKDRRRIVMVQDKISRAVEKAMFDIAHEIIEEHGRCRPGYVNIIWETGQTHHFQLTGGNKDT
jgi:hypothetical protein